MKILNDHKKTLYDERNEEASLHEGHDCIELRRKWMKYGKNGGYYEINIICVDCSIQFKSYVWGDNKLDG